MIKNQKVTQKPPQKCQNRNGKVGQTGKICHQDACKAKNPKDKRFQRTEKSIHRALHHALRERQVNLKVKDVCKSAHITTPTFYQHSASCDHALRRYEADLEREFRQLVPKRCANKGLIFTILLNFVLRHQDYFRATTNSGDYWLIIRLFRFLRPRVTSLGASEQRFIIYCHTQIAIICCWVQIDHLAPAQINHYTHQLCAT